MTVCAEKQERKGYTLERKRDRVTLRYSDRPHFYLALCALLSRPDASDFCESRALEVPAAGHMIDCARNAVFRFEYFKRYICNIALLGSSFLEVYFEDCIELPGEPYCGYLRGRFTPAEIKRLDDYCRLFGIELIPSCQTLAHYNQLFVWDEYDEIRDCNDVLLCDEQKTYDFLDKLFETISNSFTSRTVNIGMDEAHTLGLGKHLAKHGYEDRYFLLSRHLKRVIELCARHGLKPRMWSDMFFRFAFGEYYSPGRDFTPEQIAAVPDGIELIYWNYDSTTKAEYMRYMEQQQSLGKPFLFAGCSWNWLGFAPFNRYSEVRLFAGIEACKEYGVPYMLTSWSGNGNECSHFAMLSTYVMSSQKCLSNMVDPERVSQICRLLSGYSYEELVSLDLPNQVYQSKVVNYRNPCKYLFYNDVLLSQSDYHIRGDYADYYRRYANKLLKLARRESYYSYLFDLEYRLCRVLELKCDVSVRVKTAYDAGDKKTLAHIVDQVLPQIIRRAKAFYAAFTAMWDREAKPHGLEIQDLRMGGNIARLERVRARISAYVDGRIDCLEELDRENLPRSARFEPIEDNICYLDEDFVTNYSVAVLNRL